MDSRPSMDDYLLGIADRVADRSTCSRLQVGAVVAYSGRILSTGYNGAPSGEDHCDHAADDPCTVSVHAESNALAFAARHGVSTAGATLYVTHAPCQPCAGLLINAGLVRVVFRAYYRNGEGLDRLALAGLPRTYLPP